MNNSENYENMMAKNIETLEEGFVNEGIELRGETIIKGKDIV